MLRRKPSQSPLDGVDLVLADLDGVVYRGAQPIPHAVASLNLAAEGRDVAYITNNASRPDDVVADQLRRLGLDTRPEQIVTSPQAAVRVLLRQLAPGAAVLVVGGDGIVRELEKAGYRCVRSGDEAPAAVLQGFSPDVGWRELAEASFVLADPEIPWIATNTDWTLPLERGIAPGNGTLVSAVHSAVGRLPEVAGKPEAPIFEVAVERFRSADPLLVGDRLDTDILGARRAGIRSALVMTGVDGAKQVIAARPDSRPDFLLADLRQLHEPYDGPRFSRDGSTATAGGARVRVRGSAVEILDEGSSHIELLRAGSAAIWNSGLAIYALEVPERLYLDSPADAAPAAR